MEVFSRERLQKYKDTMIYKRAVAVVNQHYHLVLRAAECGHTSYLVTLTTPGMKANGCMTVVGCISAAEQPPEPTIDDIMKALRSQFPGCSIGYIETWVQQPTGKYGEQTQILKKGIQIDWS